MTGLDQCCFDVEDIDLVQHGLYQTLNSVLGRTIRAESRHAKCTSRGREYEVSTRVLGAEVWEGQLQDMKCSEEVCCELIAQVVVVLVLACCYDAVAGAIRYDIHLTPVLDALLNDLVYCLAHSYVTQQAQAVPVLPFVHLFWCVLLGPSHCSALVAMC